MPPAASGASYPRKTSTRSAATSVDMASGNLFSPVTSAVLPGDVFGQAPKVDAFYVSHSSGEPIYLERSQSPARSTSSEAQEAEQERQRLEREQATAIARAAVPQLAEAAPADARRVEGEELPTLADAFQTMLDLRLRDHGERRHPRRSASRNAYREDDNEDLDARKACTNRPSARLLRRPRRRTTCRRTKSCRVGRSRSEGASPDERRPRPDPSRHQRSPRRIRQTPQHRTARPQAPTARRRTRSLERQLDKLDLEITLERNLVMREQVLPSLERFGFDTSRILRHRSR